MLTISDGEFLKVFRGNRINITRELRICDDCLALLKHLVHDLWDT